MRESSAKQGVLWVWEAGLGRLKIAGRHSKKASRNFGNFGQFTEAGFTEAGDATPHGGSFARSTRYFGKTTEAEDAKKSISKAASRNFGKITEAGGRKENR